jgi:Raf kinase inhibitor-like YbhB/YbcL family protein
MPKKALSLLIVLLIVLIVFVLLKYRNKISSVATNNLQSQKITTTAAPMKITSPAFLDNQNIPVKYSCDGDGVNPPLVFSDVPKQAQSLALVVSDPDAPNGTWIHWLFWNLSPSINQVAENSVPAGATQGQASSGQNIYSGPCPPASSDATRGGSSGIHHYIFTLYALDTQLAIPSYSTSADLDKAMQGHIVSQAQLVGLYSRGK